MQTAEQNRGEFFSAKLRRRSYQRILPPHPTLELVGDIKWQSLRERRRSMTTVEFNTDPEEERWGGSRVQHTSPSPQTQS